jgi:predicted nuclease with RNAse H fold
MPNLKSALEDLKTVAVDVYETYPVSAKAYAKKLASEINEKAAEYLLSGRMESYATLEAMCLTLKAHFAERAEAKAAAATEAQSAPVADTAAVVEEAAAGPANDSNSQEAAAA